MSIDKGKRIHGFKTEKDPNITVAPPNCKEIPRMLEILELNIEELYNNITTLFNIIRPVTTDRPCNPSNETEGSTCSTEIACILEKYCNKIKSINNVVMQKMEDIQI